MALAGQGRTKGLVARMAIPAAINQSMVAIVPGPKLDATYLQYWLASNYQSIRHLAGGEKRDGLNQEHVGSIECPLPPLAQQHAIGRFLDRETAKIDALIAKQEQLISGLLERRSSMISLIFDRLVRDHGTIPLKRLARIPITNGLGLAGSHANPDWPRYVRTTDIADPWTLREDVFASQPPAAAAAAMLAPGDILMTAAGTIGKSTLYSDASPACYAGFLVRFRPHPGTSSRFVQWWMQSDHYWDQVRSGAVRSTIDNFSASKYQMLSAPVAPLETQVAVDRQLTQATAKIDVLISKAERFIELSNERRAALITAAVTGQIDVSASSSA